MCKAGSESHFSCKMPRRSEDYKTLSLLHTSLVVYYLKDFASSSTPHIEIGQDKTV